MNACAEEGSILCLDTPVSRLPLVREYFECIPGEDSASPDGILPSTGSTLPVLRVCDSPQGPAAASIQSINESGTAAALQTSPCVCPSAVKLATTIRLGIAFGNNASCSFP